MGHYPLIISKTHVPDRYGRGYIDHKKGGKPELFSKYIGTSDKNQFLLDYMKNFSRYVSAEIPFLSSAVNHEEKLACAVIIDIDRHAGKKNLVEEEEVQRKVEHAKKLLDGLAYAIEESPTPKGGIKFWICLDDYIEVDYAYAFAQYLEKTLETEVFPREGYTTRLPGMYKDCQNFSYDVEDRTILDNFNEIEAFLKKATNNTKAFTSFLSEIGIGEQDVKEAQKVRESKPKKRKRGRPRKDIQDLDAALRLDKLTNFSHGVEGYFDVVFEYFTGQPVPELDEKICCPFPEHDDETPSALVRWDEEKQKKMFICFGANCPISGGKDGSSSLARDALDILSYYAPNHDKDAEDQKSPFRSFTITGERIVFLRSFLMNKIVMRLFSGYTTPDSKGNMRINPKLLAEAVFKKMREPEHDDIRRDTDRVMYRYAPESVAKTWQPIKQGSAEEPAIYAVVCQTLKELITEQGFWELNARQTKEIVDMVRFFIDDPSDNFEPNLTLDWLIPFYNGVLDIRKDMAGEPDYFMPHRKDRYIISTLSCNYYKEATNDTFAGILKQFQPDDDGRNLLAQYFGMCLVPAYKTDKILICVGSGGNGKGTILNIIGMLFGDTYCSNVPVDKIGGRFNFQLHGSLVNIDPEATLGATSQATIRVIKAITGDGKVAVERKHVDSFEAHMNCKFVIACNKVPNLGEADDATLRRIVILPFTQKIPKNYTLNFWESMTGQGEQDGLPGVFNIIYAAFKELYKNKFQLPTPPGDEELRKEYFEDQDPIFGYIISLFYDQDLRDENNIAYNSIAGSTRLVNAQLETGVGSVELYADYVLYCKQVGSTKTSEIRQLTKNKFAKEFKARIKGNVLPRELQKHISCKTSSSKKMLYKLNIEQYNYSMTEEIQKSDTELEDIQ